MKSNLHVPVLRTKFYKPQIKDHYVIRQDLIDSLEENRTNPLTLVCAATGYGKSVTISEWMDCTKAKHCWISLDEEFIDLRTFIAYLVHGIRSIIPGSMEELGNHIDSAELPPDMPTS